MLDSATGREVFRRLTRSQASTFEPVLNVGDIDGDAYDDVVVVEQFESMSSVCICSGRDGNVLRSWGTESRIQASVALPQARSAPMSRAAFVTQGQVEVRSLEDGTLMSASDGNSWDTARRNVMSHTAHAMCTCSDVDGDGRNDFCLSVYDSEQSEEIKPSVPSEIWIVSSETGLLIGTIPEPEQALCFGCSLANVGDVDGDGRADIAVGSDGAAFIISLVDGRPLEVIRDPGRGDLGCIVGSAGDFDGDGRADVIVAASTTEPGRPFGVGPYFEVRSGRTGETLLHHDVRYDTYGRGTIAVAELGSVSPAHQRQIAVLLPLYDEGGVCACFNTSHSAIDILSGSRSREASR